MVLIKDRQERGFFGQRRGEGYGFERTYRERELSESFSRFNMQTVFNDMLNQFQENHAELLVCEI